MKRALIAGAAGLMLIGGAALAVRLSQPATMTPRPPAERPTLALLTSLPLMFGESFGLEGGGSAALARLELRYNVVPIGVADGASLAGKGMLLMAHPRAQPAEALVELDAWVRAGGKLLLLADPKLEWDSQLPLGDRLRPPLDFADRGLLAHWGLVLSGPTSDGLVAVPTGDYEVLAASPGRLTSSGACVVEPRGFIARCPIGKGAATIIADADLLDVNVGRVDGPAGHNLDLLIAELARFEPRRAGRDGVSPTSLSTGLSRKNNRGTIS